MVFLPLANSVPDYTRKFTNLWSQLCRSKFTVKIMFLSSLSLSQFFSLFYFIIHGGEPWKIFDDNARSMAGERRARIDSLVNGNVAWITARPLSSIFYVTRASI